MLIDGVFSGGGVKGFALVGAAQALEENGYRFRRVAGTSAGAILASFMASGYSAREIKDLLDGFNAKELLDPRNSILPLPFMKWLNLYWRMGLYKGNNLENWFYDVLAEKGVYTFADLEPGALKLVASDLTNGKIFVLPDDLEEYGFLPGSFPVAKALRMSCGIPFFFEPVRLKVGYRDTIIVDGGVLSNFPMWIFDEGNGQPKIPTIGLKLSRQSEELQKREITNALNLFEALFTTMKNAHDEKYISRLHEKDVIFIPVDGYGATDFEMEDNTKDKLMEIGRSRTLQFLQTWPSAKHKRAFRIIDGGRSRTI